MRDLAAELRGTAARERRHGRNDVPQLCEDAADELAALRAEVERLKRIEELALIWSAYQFDSRRALHQQADDAAIALLDALDSDKVAARLDAAKRCADPTTGSRDV